MSFETFNQKQEERSPEFELLEISDQKITLKNLDKMSEMLGMGESIGGNAGMFEDADGKKYPCSTHNFYANPETGEIITFGNWQDVDAEVKESHPKFNFKIASSFNRAAGTAFQKIIEFNFSRVTLSEKVKNIFAVSIDSWNRIHANQTF